MPQESPFRASRDDRRAMLGRHFLAVTETLLAEHAYAKLSVEQIIRAGNISRTTFYAYFKDKADLLLAMAGNLTEEMTRVGSEWWTLSDDATKADLQQVMRDIANVYRSHHYLMRAVVEGAGYDASLREAYDGLLNICIDALATHIDDGQAAGSINPSVPPRPTARMITYMGERSLYQFIGVENEQDDSVFPDPMAELYWRMLYEDYRPER